MTQEGWREIVLIAARSHVEGDDEPIDLLARLLAEQDEAMGALRAKGYGWMGLGWPKTIAQIPAAKPDGADGS